MSDLVDKLSHGDHAVAFSARPSPTATALKESLERGYVLVKFLETRGGTELGVTVDRGLTDTAHADFDRQQGQVTIVGGLTLDDVKVRCAATIDLASLQGVGHLQPLEA